MYVAQIDLNSRVGLLNPNEAYPGGGWETVKPLMEDMGFIFVELDDGVLPGTHYDRDAGEFYTPGPPEPEPVEPTQEELNNLLLMEGIAGLYESQVALEDRMTADNLTVMEGVAVLFEAQMGGI